MILQNKLNSKNSLIKMKEILSFLIGSRVEILDSTNSVQNFINGLVVDETKHTFNVMQNNEQIITLIKSSINKIKVNEIVFDFMDFIYGKKLKQYFNNSIVVKIKKCYD